jgi:hypothetical protein
MGASAQSHEVDPRYPIGRFQPPDPISQQDRTDAIATIAGMPGLLKAAVHGLDREQLDTPYRDGGWTVRQTVHHYADSHINAFVRLRLTLTEDTPTVKPYDEKSWAMLRDSTGAPVGWSLDLVDSLHARWVLVLDSLTEEQWARNMNHPENGLISIEMQTQIYAWHSKHHVAHITRLREQKRW